MKDLKCVVIDDDPISHSLIDALIEKTSGLVLNNAFENPEEGAAYLSHNTVDLVFLDIEMPNMSGMDILSTIKNLPPVIIISGKEKYAIEAFDFEVVDYLVKPIESYSRFLKAVNRVRSTRAAPPENQGSIFIKVDSLLVNFELKDIIWIEAYGDYVKVKTSSRVHTVYSTLKAIEEKLPKKDFIRIHRSYIVRIDQITNIDHTNLEIAANILPIGAKHKQLLLERINLL